MNFKSVKFLSVASLALAVGVTLSSCAMHDPDMARDLPTIKHDYSKSKVTAYKHLGFDFDSTPDGIFNIENEDPTKFRVNVYVGDNDHCKFVYTKDDKGTESEISKTDSFDAYLSGKNVLLDIECWGKDSNIDYKVTAYANGTEYDAVGNLSYMMESGSL